MNPYPGPTHPASNPPPNPAEQAGGTGETEQRTALLGGGQTGARPGRRRGLIGLGVLGVLAVGGVAGALVLGGGSGSAPGSGGPAPVGGPAAAAPSPQPARPGHGAGERRAGTTLLIGSVVSDTGGTLVVAPDGGGPNVTVHTDATTRTGRAGTGSAADLTPGARAVVRVRGTGDAATAVSVASPRGRVTGTVTALSGNTATLQQGNGLSVTVDVTAVTPKPAVGDLVTATGTPNGTGVTATGLRVLPKVS